MAPLGTRVLIHEKLKQWTTWVAHGKAGWYLGPAMEHYHCYHTYINATRAECIADTIKFFPTSYTMPKLSSADHAQWAALELAQALNNPHPASPLAPLGTKQLEVLQQLADIFQHAVQPKETQLLRVEEGK
jgi:hypothetical protein